MWQTVDGSSKELDASLRFFVRSLLDFFLLVKDTLNKG